MSPPDNGTLRRGASIKFKKKKSISNIPVLKDLSLKQQDPGDGGSHLRRPGVGPPMGVGSSGPSPISGTSPGPAANTPSRSRSISSDMEVRPQYGYGSHAVPLGAPSGSPLGSNDNLDKISSSSPTHQSLHRDLQRDRGRGNEPIWRQFRLGSITHETQLDFADYVGLFRSFRYGLKLSTQLYQREKLLSSDSRKDG